MNTLVFHGDLPDAAQGKENTSCRKCFLISTATIIGVFVLVVSAVSAS